MRVDDFLKRIDPVGSRDRVADDMGQDWVRDLIHRSDGLAAIGEEPDRLIRYFGEGLRPRRGFPVPVPKTGLTTRPAVNLYLDDRIAYQALVDDFAWELMADLPMFVCGWCYEVNPSGPNDLLDNQNEWLRYEAQLEEQWNEGSKYVLVTDIAGFFQSIPHSLLKDRLSTVDRPIRNLLMDFLAAWNPSQIGIPQRVLGSSLLANLYLEPVDDVLKGYRAVRWMDDIVVFCDSRREGIEAILRIQDALTSLGLVPNALKTFLVPFEKAADLVDFLRHRAIQYQLSLDSDEGDIGLADAWSKAIENPELADRTRFSFCVSRFAEHSWEGPAEEILNLLNLLPHVSDHVSRYLRSQLHDRTVLERVRRFLRGYNNQFVWQEYRLATLFWHSESLTPEQLDFCRKRARGINTYWAARTVYLRAIAKHGSRADARHMRDMAEAETHPEVSRALIVAGAESEHLTTRHLKIMARSDQSLLELVDYLNGRVSVPGLSF